MPTGQVVHFFIYDTGGEVDFATVGKLADEHPFFEELELRKIAPKYVNLPRPLVVRFPTQRITTTMGDVSADLSARIFAIGAVSFVLRFNVTVDALPDLTAWGTLRIVDAEGTSSLESFIRKYADGLLESLRPSLVETYTAAVAPETYVTYALTDAGATPRELLERDRRAVAGLVAGEAQWERLADEEVADNLAYWYRYYDDDLVIVDWDYALIVEPSGKYEDVLYILEIANLQLLELRTYDVYLDGVLDKAYDDVDRFYARGGVFLSARDVQRDLSQVRIDLSRVTDAVENITNIFGDYFLAKLYAGATERFHIKDWKNAVHEKLGALNGLYALATHEVEHRRGVTLEAAIVLLFVIDIVWLFFFK